MTAPDAYSQKLSPLAAHLSRKGIHYGWVVVAVTFLTMMVGASAVGAPGVLIGPLQKEYGWSVADISAAFAIRFLLFGAVGPFAAAFLTRFGVKRVSIFSIVLIAMGVVGSFTMSSLAELFLLWGVVVGLGTGFTAMVLGATVATRWFVARRGLVIGLLSASVATGQVLFMPAFAALEQAWGWRIALSLLLGLLAVATVVVLMLMRDHPADVGLLPYGASEAPAEAPQASSLAHTLVTPIRVLVDASRSGTFWILFGTFFICGATTTGLVQTHLVSICGDFGIAPITAAWMLAAIGAFNLVGTIGSGWLSDRFDSRWLLFWYYGLRGLSLFYLPFTDFGFYELTLFTVFYGLDWLATVPPTVKLAAERFGGNATIVFGWVFFGHQLGSALAAWGAGLTRIVYETYLPTFYIAGILCLIAALAVFAINRAQPGPELQTA
ncbi:MFS transporter [Neorhizobium sp. JUb45]|uniref:MFS transporter n=1 Tax=Neorhizobium sp. JUb45 TaxID=2485113 RepID=UPI0010D7FDFF|nr:MFS transporter [Neorhizobium sp. JUb45]TCQ99128.1 putative MFS family arabinose efflux permease [Neorhizobium sp. JUb45]